MCPPSSLASLLSPHWLSYHLYYYAFTCPAVVVVIAKDCFVVVLLHLFIRQSSCCHPPLVASVPPLLYCTAVYPFTCAATAEQVEHAGARQYSCRQYSSAALFLSLCKNCLPVVCAQPNVGEDDDKDDKEHVIVVVIIVLTLLTLAASVQLCGSAKLDAVLYCIVSRHTCWPDQAGYHRLYLAQSD